MASLGTAASMPKVCKFLLEGTCTRGSQCRYLHSNRAAASGQVECRYFRAGYCAKGEACHFIHNNARGGESKAGFSGQNETQPFARGLPLDNVDNNDARQITAPQFSSGRGHLHPRELQHAHGESMGSSTVDSNDIYFYGAPGETSDPTRGQTEKKQALNYRKLLKAEKPSHSAYVAASRSPMGTKADPCKARQGRLNQHPIREPAS